MARTPGFILLTVSLAAAVLFSAGDSGGQGQSEGQMLVEKNCQGCHTMRRVETSAKNADGWRETIQVMIQDGAEIEESEIPPMVQYLTREHGPVPEGPGKQILLNICTQCHNLQRIKIGRRSAGGVGRDAAGDAQRGRAGKRRAASRHSRLPVAPLRRRLKQLWSPASAGLFVVESGFSRIAVRLLDPP